MVGRPKGWTWVSPKISYYLIGRDPPRDYAASFSISVSIPKHIPQIGNLIGRHRIGTGLEQGLQSVVNYFEFDFAQFVFFHGGTPDKAASVIRSPNNTAIKVWQKLRQLGDVRRDPAGLIARGLELKHEGRHLPAVGGPILGGCDEALAAHGGNLPRYHRLWKSCRGTKLSVVRNLQRGSGWRRHELRFHNL
jgi:hypothetical protein